MSNFKLTIDLLPKGAWGNNFSNILSKKDWDTLRNFAYEKANHHCAICGHSGGQLDAHEVWDFDIKSKTQTLKDIVALCSACHGVKHMRNSERMGYGDPAKEHFLKINRCSAVAFASHYAEQQFLFEEQNSVLRWKLKADFLRFGGYGIELKERSIPLVENPYERVDWLTVHHVKMGKDLNIQTTGDEIIYAVQLLTYQERMGERPKESAMYFTLENKSDTMPISCPLPPKVVSVDVDNYSGTITVTSDYTNKIQWILDDELVKVKYNIGGRFTTKFSVEDLQGTKLRFKLIGNGGVTVSKEFGLNKA